MDICYKVWLTHCVYLDEEEFDTTKKYFLERHPEWHDDLELKSQTGDYSNDPSPPLEQRRAWMTVRNTIVKRYSSRGMIDFEQYAPKFYPDIKSVDADFTVTWDYNGSDKHNTNSSN